jgi:peptidoglycan/LPS O-acetylase OafA/YrhL
VQGREVKRIPTLDGWRGIAILMVLVGHFSPVGSPGPIRALGQHGVAIFFVLSGFLITTLLCAEREKHGTIDLSRFYLRRAFRILPCAWCYLAAVVLLGSGMHPRPFTASEICGALFFFRNYVGTVGLTLHFWSLSIEEQFYLVWPVLLLALGNRRARWVAISGCCLIAAWRFEHWTAVANSGGMHTLGTQYRADALLVGCLLALLMPRLRPYLRPWMAVPLLTVLAFCAARYTDMVPLYESVDIALVLAVTSQCSSALASWLSWKPLSSLGVVSYSIYVWQVPFAVTGSHNPVPVLVVLLPAMLAASLASYHFIERPMIAFGRRLPLLTEERMRAREAV